jgi:hypothetical protein
MSHETLNLNADADVEEAMLRAVAARAIEEALEGEPQAVPHDPGKPIDITEAQAVARLAPGLQFAADDDVTVHARGTDLSITLDDLDSLGIDHVMADLETIENDPVHDQGDVLMALGLDTTSPSADPAADMLALLESFDEPIFVDAANAGITFSRAESDAFAAAPDALQDDVVARLVDLGVDFVNVVGTENPDDSINL